MESEIRLTIHEGKFHQVKRMMEATGKKSYLSQKGFPVVILRYCIDREAVIRIRLHGQVVKTPPFHGGNTGSNPVGVIFLRKEHMI